MATYTLKGGPCDGQQSRNFTILPLENFTIFCGGHDYDFARADRAFHDAGISFGGDAGAAMRATGAHRGWHELQVAINRNAPTALLHAQRLRRATRRRLGKRRR